MNLYKALIAVFLFIPTGYGSGNANITLFERQESPIQDLDPPLGFKSEAIEAENLVRIYPETVHDIGGYRKVQELFGIMTGNMDSRAQNYLEDANFQASRNIINYLPQPGQKGYKLASWNEGSPRFETRAASNEWFRNTFIEGDPYDYWDDLLKWASGYFEDRFGPVSVTLCGNPGIFDPRLEMDLDAAREHVAAYVEILKGLGPADAGSELRFFNITNEPDLKRSYAAYFDHDQQLAVESYTRVFNALYDHMNQVHPDVNFIGTCVGHNGAYVLHSGSQPEKWDTWVKYFVDHVENPRGLEYYEAHAYGIPILRDLAYVSMTQNYAENKRGVRPRFLLTEISNPTGDTRAENYQNQFIFHAMDLFMMLHHPDKYVTRHAFVASPHYKNQHSFFYEVEGTFTAQAPYWVYRTYQNLRGKNLYYESDHEHVRVFASAPRDDKIVIGLFNPTSGAQTVNIDPGVTGSDISRIVRRKAVFDYSSANANYTSGELSLSFPHSLEMEAGSAYAIEIELTDSMQRTKTVKTREFYGSKAREEMSDTLKVQIPLPYLPEKNGQAYLRIGINKRQDSGQYGFELNGKTFSVNWSDTPDKVTKNWNHMVGYIEVPVDKANLNKNNELILDPLSDNMLLFTSIVYDLYSYDN
mgnify:CR=1 FL=1